MSSSAKVVSWDESSDNKSGGKGRVNFLKFEAGKTFRVRLLCTPVKFLFHWKPVKCRPPFPDEQGRITDPIVLRGLAEEAKTRFSGWFFDRADGQLKVADFPITLLEQFKVWKEAHNEPPGGKNGPDWYIKVVKKNNLTQYTASALDRAPLTAEEIAIVKGYGGSEALQQKLGDLRKPHTPEEIETMLEEQGIVNPGGAPESPDEPSDEPDSSAEPEAQPEPPPPAKKPAAPATPAAGKPDANDPFGW